MADAKLNIKEQMFCNEYIRNGGHGTNAVIASGYSENGASVQASRMLVKPKIRETIRKQEEYAILACSISKEQIVQEQYELYQLARADERYKDASTILGELTNLLGYKPKQEDRKVLHSHSFEQLLRKDITPANPAIAMD
jgi:phage terminase small subunit